MSLLGVFMFLLFILYHSGIDVVSADAQLRIASAPSSTRTRQPHAHLPLPPPHATYPRCVA
jgi:hypothetical protein